MLWGMRMILFCGTQSELGCTIFEDCSLHQTYGLWGRIFFGRNIFEARINETLHQTHLPFGRSNDARCKFSGCGSNSNGSAEGQTFAIFKLNPTSPGWSPYHHHHHHHIIIRSKMVSISWLAAVSTWLTSLRYDDTLYWATGFLAVFNIQKIRCLNDRWIKTIRCLDVCVQCMVLDVRLWKRKGMAAGMDQDCLTDLDYWGGRRFLSPRWPHCATFVGPVRLSVPKIWITYI